MRLTVGQLKTLVCEARDDDDLLDELHREILEALQAETGQENVKAADNMIDRMIVVDSETPTIPEAMQMIKSIVWFVCGEEPSVYTRPAPSKWNNKTFSITTNQVTVKVERYIFTGPGVFDVVMWRNEKDVGLREADETHEQNELLDDVFMELYQFVADNGTVNPVVDADDRRKEVWTFEGDNLTAKAIAQKANDVMMSLVTDPEQRVYTNRSGRQGPTSYTVHTKGCNVRIDVFRQNEHTRMRGMGGPTDAEPRSIRIRISETH